MKNLITWLLLSTIFALFLAGCTSIAQTPTGNAVCDIEKGCDDNDDYIKIPISEISSNMKKYSYKADGIKINYFVVEGTNGKPRTAFDACDVCGGYRGYRQRGKDVVCNNCGRFFRIDDIGTKNGPGGCWPSFLDHEIDGDNILIKKSEIAKGAFRFR